MPKANLGTVEEPDAQPGARSEMQRLSAVLGIPACRTRRQGDVVRLLRLRSCRPDKEPRAAGLVRRSSRSRWSRSTTARPRHAEGHGRRPAGARAAGAVSRCDAQIEEVRNYPAPDNASAAQLIGHVGKISQSDIDRAKNPTDAATLKTAAEYRWGHRSRRPRGAVQLLPRRHPGHRDLLGDTGRHAGLDGERGAGDPRRHRRDEHRRQGAADRRSMRSPTPSLRPARSRSTSRARTRPRRRTPRQLSSSTRAPVT